VVRYVGMAVHREFAQIAVSEEGLVRDEGRIGVTPEDLRAWAETLHPSDHVALEATGNSDAIATLLSGRVARVVVSNSAKTRAIAEATPADGRRPEPGSDVHRQLPEVRTRAEPSLGLLLCAARVDARLRSPS
jgi:hypothetical protein